VSLFIPEAIDHIDHRGADGGEKCGQGSGDLLHQVLEFAPVE
jgi:hypothetical protein